MKIIAALACTAALAAAPVRAQDAPKYPAPAPMFRDPITDGAADPVFIYHSKAKQWWGFYTQRRANVEAADVAFCYGTQIGVAMTSDNGRSWVYKGTLPLDFEPGLHTYWAPEVVFDGQQYHLFVTYIEGVRNHWGGTSRTAHYQSKDLWNWKLDGFADFDSRHVIDVSVLQMPGKTWRVWYKDQDNGSSISTGTSRDLTTWKRDKTPAIPSGWQEGPKVFRFKGHYWMLTDEHLGQRIYRSDDALKWEKQGLILDVPGTRPQDTPQGAHADVIVTKTQAFVVYFTHPGRTKTMDDALDENGNTPYSKRRSVLQVAELVEKDGALTCDRNAPFEFYLPNE